MGFDPAPRASMTATIWPWRGKGTSPSSAGVGGRWEYDLALCSGGRGCGLAPAHLCGGGWGGHFLALGWGENGPWPGPAGKRI